VGAEMGFEQVFTAKMLSAVALSQPQALDKPLTSRQGDTREATGGFQVASHTIPKIAQTKKPTRHKAKKRRNHRPIQKTLSGYLPKKTKHKLDKQLVSC
jgi:hypothetical protein